jgi:UDP-N-acetylglucosamine--N-acetylmuramyl-(pentapeptide) pyrophosphoryl-undecaprenol N-acetylglucosamine transferase
VIFAGAPTTSNWVAEIGLGLTSVGAADVFAESEFTPDALAGLLARRLSDPHGLAVRAAAARASARPEAAKTLADLAEQASL